MSPIYPTRPTIHYHDEETFKVWQNDDHWWVAHASGRDFHGCCEAAVVAAAVAALGESDDECVTPRTATRSIRSTFRK